MRTKAHVVKQLDQTIGEPAEPWRELHEKFVEILA